MAHDHLWANLRDLLAAEDAELAGGADPNPVLRQRFTERTGCDRTFSTYQELLNDAEPHAVLGFSATARHAEIVELCAERGIHVMVEKPMAGTLEQASRMLTAARRNGVTLMVNWPTAWSRQVRTAYRLVREGRLGQVWQLTWRGGHCGPDELGCSGEFCEFLFDAELNGAGAFNDYGGYGASLCVLFMQGLPHTVFGMAGRLVKTQLPVDDNGIMLLRYPHALCRLEMTWTEAVSHQPPHDLVLYGTEATLVTGEELTLHERKQEEPSTVPLDPLPPDQRCAVEHFLHYLRRVSKRHFLGLAPGDCCKIMIFDLQRYCPAFFIFFSNKLRHSTTKILENKHNFVIIKSILFQRCFTPYRLTAG
jgi:predicted dehydrogenase